LRRQIHVSLNLALAEPDLEPARLGDHLSQRFTVAQLVRYFGCLPCQDWLLKLSQAAPALASLDASAIAVGGSAAYQARWLRDERGVQIPLLLDPEHEFRTAVEATKPLGVRMLDPRGMAAYVRALREGLHPQGLTRDVVRAPGVVILDQSGTVRWQYLGNRVGDYPTLSTVRRELQQLT
jgi:peroxiredoxin